MTSIRSFENFISESDTSVKKSKVPKKISKNSSQISYPEYLSEKITNNQSPSYLDNVTHARNLLKEMENRYNIYNISFQKEILDFLEYDNLENFISNIDNIKYYGKSPNGLDIFNFIKNDESIKVKFDGKNFSKYDGDVNEVYSENDIEQLKKDNIEIDEIIKQNKLEVQKIDNEEIIIDDDVLELMSKYKDKIKNFYDNLINESCNLDIEKNNLETLMNVEILKI